MTAFELLTRMKETGEHCCVDDSGPKEGRKAYIGFPHEEFPPELVDQLYKLGHLKWHGAVGFVSKFTAK